MTNARTFKVLRKKDSIILEIEGQTLILDEPSAEMDKKILELVKDENALHQILERWSMLSYELSYISDMKAQSKVLSKQLSDFIQQFDWLYKTKEYRQVIDKFRRELDRAFDIPKS